MFSGKGWSSSMRTEPTAFKGLRVSECIAVPSRLHEPETGVGISLTIKYRSSVCFFTRARAFVDVAVLWIGNLASMGFSAIKHLASRVQMGYQMTPSLLQT